MTIEILVIVSWLLAGIFTAGLIKGSLVKMSIVNSRSREIAVWLTSLIGWPTILLILVLAFIKKEIPPGFCWRMSKKPKAVE